MSLLEKIPEHWVGTLGVGRDDRVTLAEIDSHPEWLGFYIPLQDTRDYVLLQEHVLEQVGSLPPGEYPIQRELLTKRWLLKEIELAERESLRVQS